MLEAKAAILPKAIFGNILLLPDFATILWYRLSAETFLKDFCRLKMVFFLPYKMKLINVLKQTKSMPFGWFCGIALLPSFANHF